MTGNTKESGRTKGTVEMHGERAMVAERVFEAPRARVWAAYNDPKLIPRWWGPAQLTNRVERMEVWPGGKWRIVSTAADGTEFGFHGEYREVVPPEKLVQTFVWEGAPNDALVQTATFHEEGNRTRMKLYVEFPSAANRKAMVDTGMEGGMREGWDRLDVLLAAA